MAGTMYVCLCLCYVPFLRWAVCKHSMRSEWDSGRCEFSCHSTCIPVARMLDQSSDAACVTSQCSLCCRRRRWIWWRCCCCCAAYKNEFHSNSSIKHITIVSNWMKKMKKKKKQQTQMLVREKGRHSIKRDKRKFHYKRTTLSNKKW